MKRARRAPLQRDTPSACTRFAPTGIIRPVVDQQPDSARWLKCVPTSARAVIIALALMLSPLACPNASAQDETPSTTSRGQEKIRELPITGDRLSGIVLPIEPIASDITLSALRANAWTVDDTKRLYLEGDVEIRMGGYHFTAPEAVIWLNRIPSAKGLINQIAIYFNRASDPAKQAGLGIGGEDLLVTGSARGEVKLDVTSLLDGQPKNNPMVKKAEQRLADYLRNLFAQTPKLQDRPQVDASIPPDVTFKPVPGGEVTFKDVLGPNAVPAPPRQDSFPWLARPQGIVRFSAAKTEIRSGVDENVILIDGPLAVDMQAGTKDGDITQLTLTAERAVIFTDSSGPKGLASGQLSAKSVRGIYLEGNVSAVVNNGLCTARAPRMYYDFRGDRAIMVDSILRTYPRDEQVPVYARAKEMRQLSANQWDTNTVNVSTSEFFTPNLSIGARQATITQKPMAGNPKQTEMWADTRGTTMLVAGVPILPFPDFNGRMQNPPLKSVEFGTRKNDGLLILTTWDLFALTGSSRIDGVEAELKVDSSTKRGVGLGSLFKYDVGGSHGTVDLYGLYDEGTDRTTSGENVKPDKDFRGVALLENTTRLSEYWSMQAQLAYISDRTFITNWRPDDFNERREYETALYLKHQKDNAAFDFLAKYDLNNFISNSYLLASTAYAVDKAPEVTYRRYGDSLFGDSITYSTENRVTHLRQVFQDSTPNQIGVPGAAFGIGNDENIADALRARGLTEDWVNRFDSRHEVAMPIQAGFLKFTPFLVGRFTAYDDDFESYSSDADAMRFFGAAGLRINTQFQRVFNGVESDLFDLHRLRHIVEPYVTLWYAYASVNQEDLPVYDAQVESLADGGAVEVGVRNTLQTQRGGPGQWRSVDYLTLDTSLIITDPEDQRESPTPQFFDYRPEYSQMGSSLHASTIWLLSDSLSLVGEETYDLDNNVFARGAVGLEMRHTPLLLTYIEYRYIDADQNELLAVSWTYQLTRKYAVSLTPQWDFEADDFRSVSAKITRTFPDFTFTLQVRYDQIADDTSFGARVGLVEF